MRIVTALRRATIGLAIVALLVALASCRRRPPEPDRVAKERIRSGPEIKRLCQAAGVKYPPQDVYLRAFNHEGGRECWPRGVAGDPLKLRKEFKITSSSG